MNDFRWDKETRVYKKNDNTFWEASADPWVRSKKKGKARPKKFHK